MQQSGARPRNVVIVFNSTAGRSQRKRLDLIIHKLSEYGCRVEVRDTQFPGHAEEITRQINDSEVDVVAAAGGDGTVKEVVNGLRGKSMALAVIPLGTANVLACEVGVSRKPERIAETVALGTLRKIYVGNANGRRFVMMAGIGFDAEVVDGVRLPLKRAIGPLAYVWEMARLAFVYGFKEYKIQIDAKTYHAVSAIVCNGRYYGGPFVAAPSAKLEDKCFQVILFENSGWHNVLRYGLALVTARLPRLPDVQIVPGKHIRISGRKNAPVQADGDVLTRLPAVIEIDNEPVLFTYPV